MKMSELKLWCERCKALDLSAASRAEALQMVVDEARHKHAIAMMESDAACIVDALCRPTDAKRIDHVNMLHCNDDRTCALLETEEAKALMARPGCPRIYGPHLDVPDLVVVWDSGEGPHSPEGDMKEGAIAIPQEIWDHVGTLVKNHYGRSDVYCVAWLIGNY